MMLQAVQELYETEAIDEWPEDTPRSCKFVLIGKEVVSLYFMMTDDWSLTFEVLSFF